MMKRITALALALMLLLTTVSLSALADDTPLTGVVKGGWLRVRQSPSTAASVVARVYTGTQVKVLGASGSSWYQIQLATGQTGYVMSNYVTVSGSVPSTDVGSTGALNIQAWVTSANGKSVRLRSGPSTNYGTLGSYPVGTAATILSKGTYWFQVSIAGKTGYMMSQFLTTVQPGTGSTGDTTTGGTTGDTTGGSTATGYTAWVTSANGKSVNLRSGAGTNYRTVGRYSVGTPVTVIVHGAEWDYIRVGTRAGYMMTAYLTTTQPPAGSAGSSGTTGGTTGDSTSTGGYTAYVTSANGKSVRMRSGAGTGYGVLYQLPVGTEVTVLSHGTTWDRIRYNTTDGYMMNEFLTTVKPGTTPVTPSTPSTSTTYTAYVISGNGKSVNLRAGAGTGFTTLIQLPVGTAVTVGASANGWSKVTYGAYSGYMMTQYLNTAPGSGSSGSTSGGSGSSTNGVVTAAALNNYAPAVGTSISAIITPNGAAVNYAWVDGSGTVLGSEATYTVKAADVGKTIGVRVTGKGVWTGTATSPYTAPVTASATKTALTGVIIGGTPTVGRTLTAQAQPAGATASYIWYRLSDGTMLGSGASYTPTAADEGSTLFVTAVGNGNYTGAANSAHTSAVQPAPSTGDVLLAGTVTLPAVKQVGEHIVPDINLNTNEYKCYWTVDGSVYSIAGTLLVTQAMEGKTIRLTVEAIAGSGYTGSVASGECRVSVPAVASPTDLGI